jgi:SprT protein
LPLKDHELSILKNYLPPNTAERVIEYMHSYKIHLKIKRERKSILGDYRPAHDGKPHTISVNANLNTYHFLITFLHELAHLINHLNHGRNKLPHGKEWKQVFSVLLKQFTEASVFPADIEQALLQSMNNLAASTCSDPFLFKVLRTYDEQTDKVTMDHLSVGDLFKTDSNQTFQMISKRRTRYVCEEIFTKKQYLFPSIYEVLKV